MSKIEQMDDDSAYELSDEVLEAEGGKPRGGYPMWTHYGTTTFIPCCGDC